MVTMSSVVRIRISKGTCVSNGLDAPMMQIPATRILEPRATCFIGDKVAGCRVRGGGSR